MSKVFQAPEDPYYEFFRADSAKDARAWAAVMSYPHTRVSATGNSPYYPTPEDYAARASWTAREATGWVRSVGVDPIRIHESVDKVHLAGGWTRYNARDEPILRNRVTYIVTRIDGSWGIQARFGTDSFTEGEVLDSSAPLGVVAAHLENWAAGDIAAATESLIYPFTNVGVGRVDRYGSASEVADELHAETPETVGDIRPVLEGRDGIVAAATWRSVRGSSCQAVFLVARREAGWRMAAASIIASR
ncbi:MAG: hypothetical protein OXQ90_13245 [Gammaproteobacteria bacterium]|nr:hypothetical protein [Gammaproteobacteria bacterium]